VERFRDRRDLGNSSQFILVCTIGDQMGVWGTGLYSGDFAMDLRTTISAVARLPFDGDKLVDILCESEPAAANNPDDSDHTTFWLVVADQFAKRAIACSRVRDKALTIIDTGADITMLEKLGMDPAGLAKRRKMLVDVRARVTAPVAAIKPRPVLKKPQPLLMDIGDLFAYPTFGGRCINPYFASKEDYKCWTTNGPAAWKQDGWSAMVIVDCGRAFDFLSWYRPLTISAATAQKPTLAALHGEVLWRLARGGTCSAVHFKRLELEKLGTLAVDAEKLSRLFPGMKPSAYAAVGNISIANALNVAPSVPEVIAPKPGEPRSLSQGRPNPALLGIEQILTG